MTPRQTLAAALCLLALAGCGNKGPLVRPADLPPADLAEPAPVPDEDALPELTPPAEPPVTDTVAPPPEGDGG